MTDEWCVRGLPLPVPLIEMLRAGAWRNPGPRVLAELMPWFEDPLEFPADLTELRRHDRSLETIADSPSMSELFRSARGSRSTEPIALPWLDVDRAVLIAINKYAGDDVAVVLDYRTDPADPRVVASDVTTNPAEHTWRLVTPTLTEFLQAW